MDLLSAEASADLRYTGSADLGQLAPWLALEPAPRGVVSFAGEASGPLAAPKATFDVRAIALAGLDSTTSRFRRAVDPDSAATLETLRVALDRGELTGEARVPFDAEGTGRARVSWNGLNIGQIAEAVAPTLGLRLASVAAGNIALDWTGQDVLSARGTISNRLAAPSRSPAHWRSRAALTQIDRGDWRASLDHTVGDGIVLNATVGGRLDANDLAASTVQGRTSLTVAQLHEALQHLADAGVALGADARRFAPPST